MEDVKAESEGWLDREDRSCRPERVDRLVWLASLMPEAEYVTFPGGWMAKHLFEEARYSFVYAQFLAAVVLGFAFVEHTLAAMFHSAGRDDLGRAPAAALIREAVDVGWLSTRDGEWLERARRLRNPVAHFRAPGLNDTIERRSVSRLEAPYDVLEEDARHLMAAVGRLISQGAL
jgi:hypothetical protein